MRTAMQTPIAILAPVEREDLRQFDPKHRRARTDGMQQNIATKTAGESPKLDSATISRYVISRH